MIYIYNIYCIYIFYIYLCCFVIHLTRVDIAVKKQEIMHPDTNLKHCLLLYFVIRYLRNGQSDFK